MNLQETSPSVVFIKMLELPNTSNSSKDILLTDETSAKVEGTGSGFLWDKFGHIVGFSFSYFKYHHYISDFLFHVFKSQEQGCTSDFYRCMSKFPSAKVLLPCPSVLFPT